MQEGCTLLGFNKNAFFKETLIQVGSSSEVHQMPSQGAVVLEARDLDANVLVLVAAETLQHHTLTYLLCLHTLNIKLQPEDIKLTVVQKSVHRELTNQKIKDQSEDSNGTVDQSELT